MIPVLMNGDCLELMQYLADGSVDMVLCDLPYGTTQNKWDAVIPFDQLWAEYRRVVKPNGAIVLTAAQPFTSALVMSNPGLFKYDWTWRKEKGTGHLNAKKMPMRDKEDVLVFYAEQPTYNPQFGEGKPYDGAARVGKKQQTDNYGKYAAVREDNDGKRYPKQVIEFNSVGRGGEHPTQKPVALMEYMIRTYTNPGDTVLDNTMGSGTTGVACANTGREFIGIERDPEYFRIASERIDAAVTSVQHCAKHRTEYRMMAYNPNSDTLRQHRERLLGIAMQHAIATGLRSLNRAKIAAEAGVSLGVVSCALGKRDEMTQLVMDTARSQGVELKYA